MSKMTFVTDEHTINYDEEGRLIDYIVNNYQGNKLCVSLQYKVKVIRITISYRGIYSKNDIKRQHKSLTDCIQEAFEKADPCFHHFKYDKGFALEMYKNCVHIKDSKYDSCLLKLDDVISELKTLTNTIRTCRDKKTYLEEKYQIKCSNCVHKDKDVENTPCKKCHGSCYFKPTAEWIVEHQDIAQESE